MNGRLLFSISAVSLFNYYLLVGDFGVFDPRYYRPVESNVLDQKMARVFRYQMHQLNEAKSKDAPVALVLQSSVDENGAFSGRALRRQMSSLAKTHRIAWDIIDHGERIPKAIERTSKIAKPPQLLVLSGHGNPSAIKLSDTQYYSRPKPSDFKHLPQNAQIILDSCSTGKAIDSSLTCLAERVAYAAAPRSVYAAKKEVETNGLCMRYCLEHGKVEMWHVQDYAPKKKGDDFLYEKSRFGQVSRNLSPNVNKERLFREFKVIGGKLSVNNAPWWC